MIQPRRAVVRPRVISEDSGAALPVEEEIRGLLDEGAYGVVALVGSAGSGKTTTLQHLAAILPAEYVTLLDQPPRTEPCEPSSGQLTVYAAEVPHGVCHRAILRLAPWGQDELIEYLLARHKSRCASVIKRIQPEEYLHFRGIPDVWQIVLELLAADDSLPDGRTALYRYLAAQLPDTDLVERARSACLNAVAGRTAALDALCKPGFAPGLVRLLRHQTVTMLLAAERMAADLHGDADCDYLALRLPRELIKAAAQEIRSDERTREHLNSLLAGPSWSHAMVASLLHALDPTWVPGPVPKTLAGAFLDGVVWPGIDLSRADLTEADLSGANLSAANLSGAFANKAILAKADLRKATLDNMEAACIDLSHANLTAARAEWCRLAGANLQHAVCEDAALTDAVLAGADLSGANFCGASLVGANLRAIGLRHTDFTGANLRATILSALRLRQARFWGACFRGAELCDCDLEFMDLDGVNFQGANLQGALLTGALMAHTNFEAADLRGARLADVNWQGACLRDADLRGATFHMGSSRSGLVGSPIACEGSRTGFYTDDYEEQYFKAPEEIRKANLCGTDLRGATIRDVDFYLVDLRGAEYDRRQESHFRHCRAILSVHR